ncbi:glycosyltransferase family 1 protein [Crepidotus variabilis]|uniref:UDP-N-acetylglucosamine transferase subunit ALG13 n=1 Tax=Crepidotus variabilis TaxID=179855 RepID=A0A9P6JLZ1_9AGAR|nr:glycosyltransferase family 1 protein [Crepidotus variabilis]
MIAFITVGSTRFDALIAAIFTSQVLSTFKKKGYTKLTVQCGHSTFKYANEIKNGETKALDQEGIEIKIWKFKPSLEEEFEKADLVVGHAGSGTILDVLRKGKAMIVVPNPTLLDNHQVELAERLEEMEYLIAATVETLPQAIKRFDTRKTKPFPPFDGSRFAKIVDEALGFT